MLNNYKLRGQNLTAFKTKRSIGMAFIWFPKSNLVTLIHSHPCNPALYIQTTCHVLLYFKIKFDEL